jgi:lipid-A-disaccharide synthase
MENRPTYPCPIALAIMPSVPDNLRFMIVAGEASGDAHAAALVNSLREAAPDRQLNFFGATGALMRKAGVESIVHSDDLAILGLLEIGRALPKFWEAYKHLKQAGIDRKPDAVILVDWPDFNFRLARSLHRRGIKIIYYISPQLWAWRSHRRRTIFRDVDLLLSILPFEMEWYAERGINHVEFVGHPLAGEVKARYGKVELCRLLELDPQLPIVSLLPGSRKKEVRRILPPMLDAAASISATRREIQFVVVVAPGRSPEELKAIIDDKQASGANIPAGLRITRDNTRETLAASDAAAIASGTATLEAALLGTPMVIVYKESAINWHILGSLINTDHYGLVNLIAGERVATELMQNEFTGPRLASELLSLLDEKKNQAMRSRLREVIHRLGDGGASRRAAQRILTEVP